LEGALRYFDMEKEKATQGPLLLRSLHCHHVEKVDMVM
jgi:hypothetical protein